MQLARVMIRLTETQGSLLISFMDKVSLLCRRGLCIWPDEHPTLHCLREIDWKIRQVNDTELEVEAYRESAGFITVIFRQPDELIRMSNPYMSGTPEFHYYEITHNQTRN